MYRCNAAGGPLELESTAAPEPGLPRTPAPAPAPPSPSPPPPRHLRRMAAPRGAGWARGMLPAELPPPAHAQQWSSRRSVQYLGLKHGRRVSRARWLGEETPGRGHNRSRRAAGRGGRSWDVLARLRAAPCSNRGAFGAPASGERARPSFPVCFSLQARGGAGAAAGGRRLLGHAVISWVAWRVPGAILYGSWRAVRRSLVHRPRFSIHTPEKKLAY